MDFYNKPRNNNVTFFEYFIQVHNLTLNGLQYKLSNHAKIGNVNITVRNDQQGKISVFNEIKLLSLISIKIHCSDPDVNRSIVVISITPSMWTSLRNNYYTQVDCNYI